MLDSRGHSASDKPHTPAAYTLPERVGDVMAVLDALHVQQAHFFGYSMGGWIGFGMAKYAPQRVCSLILGGAHPYPDRRWEAFRQVDGSDPEAFTAALEAVVGEPIPIEIKPLVLAGDLRALAAAAQERLSADQDLMTVAMPCLLFAGEEDARYAAVREYARQLPRASFVALPGLNHIAAYVRSDFVVPHIMQFLARVPGRHIRPIRRPCDRG